MARACLRVALIGGIANRRHGGEAPIRLRAGVTLILPTLLERASGTMTTASKS